MQRAYNASAVRVIEQDLPTGDANAPTAAVADAVNHGSPNTNNGAASDNAGGSRVSGTINNAINGIFNVNGGGSGGANKNAVVKVVPAVDSREGTLCVEMRIRLYKDGAMSKLLEQLPNVSLQYLSRSCAVVIEGGAFTDLSLFACLVGSVRSDGCDPGRVKGLDLFFGVWLSSLDACCVRLLAISTSAVS